jgi:hypothetical protein
MRAGFELALDPERGKYGSNRTRRYDQMRTYHERLFGGPRHGAPLLDRQLTWTAFVPAEARGLWRRMADRHVSSEGDEFGVRAAEGIIDAIYAVSMGRGMGADHLNRIPLWTSSHSPKIRSRSSSSTVC